MAIALNIAPAPSALGVPRSTPISFDLVSTNPIDFVVLVARYKTDQRRFMVYETDGFVAPFSDVSTISGIGTGTVQVAVFEPGGWRSELRELRAIGIDASGVLFDVDVTKIQEAEEAMQLLDTIKHSGAAVQQLTFGASGDGVINPTLTPGVYRIMGTFKLIDDPGSIFLRPNDIDASVGAIGTRARTTLVAAGDGGSASDSTVNGIRIGGHGLASRAADVFVDMQIDLRVGVERGFKAENSFNQDIGGALGPSATFRGSWPDDTTVVTSLVMRADNAGAILADTDLALYRIETDITA